MIAIAPSIFTFASRIFACPALSWAALIDLQLKEGTIEIDLGRIF
jgi:hypothetical protein